MDFIDILITIGLIIYIFAALRKKKKAAEKKTTQPRSGWLGKLESFIEDVKKEMEEAAAEAERQEREAHGYMDDMEPEEEALPDFFAKKAQPQAPPHLPEEERLRYEEPSFEQEIPPLPLREPSAPTEKTEVCAVKKKKTCRKRKRSITQKRLQNAVVWSEILASPIALKDERP